ncbi:MAG: hypothetical protein HUK06_00650 [Bacteroidaceae bacterium]|nr:hypothetical protein [Bacteroidaceae bacterium]
MALINCPECKGKVSSKAAVCIHCGYPLKKVKNKTEEKLQAELEELKRLNKTLLNQQSQPDKTIADFIKEAIDKEFPPEPPFDLNNVNFPMGWYF